MDNTHNNDELYHYGRLGMKWGQSIFGRKSSGGGKGNNRKNVKKVKKHQKPQKQKPKTLSELSDSELRERISRLELERRYRDLSPKKVSAGKAFLDKFVIPVATDTGKRLATDFIIKQGRKALGLEESKGDDYVDILKKEVSKLTLEKKYENLTGSKYKG